MEIARTLELLNITEEDYINYKLPDTKPKLLVKDAKYIIENYKKIFCTYLNKEYKYCYSGYQEFETKNIKTVEIHITWCLYILSHYKTVNCLIESNINAIKNFIPDYLLNKQLVLIILSLPHTGQENFRNLYKLREKLLPKHLTVLSCTEILQLCDANLLIKLFADPKNILNKYDEWIDIILKTDNCDYLLQYLIFKDINKEQLLKCIEVFKKYNNQNLIFKAYVEFSHLIKPDYKIINDSYNSSILIYNCLSHIKKCNIKKLSNELYSQILHCDYKIWSKYANFSKETLIIAYKAKYYDIIIEHYSKKSCWEINDNLYIRYLLKEPIDYNKVSTVIKNCPSFDIDIMLDLIDTRFEKLNCIFSEFCLNYISPEKITIHYLKKFLRINSFLKDLHRFNINYDQILYNLCAIHKIYPKEYMTNMIIDKHIIKARQLIGNDLRDYILDNNIVVDEFMFSNLTKNVSYSIGNKVYYQTLYTILIEKLFKFPKIIDVDNEIINILEKHFNI